MMDFVIQAYGRDDILAQSTMCALSMLRYDFSGTIYFVTDQSEKFNKFFEDHKNIKVIELTSDKLSDFRGKIDFVHRAKLAIILWVNQVRNNPQKPLIYLDGDTFFQENPLRLLSRIKQNRSLMHIKEGQLASSKEVLTKKIAKFCRKNTFPLELKNKDQKKEFHNLKISDTTWMWNAGVIGLLPEDLYLIENALSLTDVAYSRYQKHVIEQLAVSYFLQEHTEVIATDDIIYHYWQHKDFWMIRIQEFLSGVDNSKNALAKIDQFDFSLPLTEINQNKSKPWFLRFKEKLQKL